MSQVETVALWAGLISSIAGIFLSVVATVFAVWVSKEAAEVNQQMIRSLQKIESTVEHLSADTRELITAGWNKMLTGLGGGDGGADTAVSDVSEQISSGIASEVRSELTEAQDTGAESDSHKIDRFERALQDLKDTLASQLRRRDKDGAYQTSVDELAETVRGLPVEARALLSLFLRGRHLTRKEYRSAAQNQSLKTPLRALRSAGLLMPLEAFEAGEPVPVYHLPPGLERRLRIASRLAGDVPHETLDAISAALNTIGYQSAR